MDRLDEAKTKKKLKNMLVEAITAQKKMLHESIDVASSNALSQDALDAAERISKDEDKLNKFIEKNKYRIEKTLAKMKKPEDKKWYARAWEVVKRAAVSGAKFIAKHWLDILQLLVILAIGAMLGKLLFGAKDIVEKAAKWMVQDAAASSVQKMTQTNGLGAFFDPGAAF